MAEEILSDTPVLVVSGARQVGKSTLVKQLLEGRNARLLNLDDSTNLTAAQSDPDGFIQQFPDGILAIDEVQRAPELFRAIKNSLELDRRPGRFIVTGSSNLVSLHGGEESLAGRAETLRLHGFSQGEITGREEDFANFAWNLNPESIPDTPSDYSRPDYLELITRSGFPEIAHATQRRRDRWVDAYVERVISKDASELYGLHYPDRLRDMLDLITSQGSSEFVATQVGRRLNIPERSVPTYLEALTSVFLVESLPGWGRNLGKRAVSRGKVFAQDSGLATSLAGLSPDALDEQISSPVTGGLLESFVAAELLKQRTWSNISYRMFHFRSSTGKEVDLVLEDRSRRIIGIEVKAAVSIGTNDFTGLKHLRELAGEHFVAGIILHAGREILPMGDRLWAMPISTLWNV